VGENAGRIKGGLKVRCSAKPIRKDFRHRRAVYGAPEAVRGGISRLTKQSSLFVILLKRFSFSEAMRKQRPFPAL
jgi:hypothetical protein